MDRQEKIKWLSRSNDLAKKLKWKDDDIQMAYDRAMKTTPTISDMPMGSSGGSKVETGIEEVDHKIRERDEIFQEQLYVQVEIEEAIQTLTNPDHQTILRYMYISGEMNKKKVAAMMAFSYGWIKKAFEDAIDSIIIEKCSRI